ncbi:MAG TPA: hypothetical protein VJM53_01210 [Burkholderiales bacterium]|nr:hypothetical protein [Burkholderiales bacterium]
MLSRFVAILLILFCYIVPARAIDLSPLFTEKTQPSGEFLGLLTQIRDVLSNSGAAQGGPRCAEGAMAEARLAIPRTLSSGVSTADFSTTNEYFTRDVAPEGITGNHCAVTFTASWNKGLKGGAAGSAGIIRVLITITCPCTAGTGTLKSATVSFSVPVNVSTKDEKVKYDIGPAPPKFVVEAECCTGRKEPKSYLSLDGALVGVIPDPDAAKPATAPAQPPRTATQPYTSPPPPPSKPVPPPPPSPPKTSWTVENPCPECEPIRQHLLRERQNAENAQAQIDEFGRLLRENEAKQAEAKAKIAQLNRELARQQGTGGSAYDPDTGNTTDAWTQADGSVKITVRDANGNVIEQRTRPSRAAAKIKADIAAEEAKLKELGTAREQLQHELEYAQKLKAKHLKLADDLLKLLQDCIEEKCNTPQQISCVMQPSQAITIGPKEKFGPESATSSVATGLLSGALGSLMGGRGGDSGGGSGPELKTDPVKDKQVFTDPTTGTKVAIGSIIKEGRLLTSVKIEDAKEGEPVIHQMYRERLVPQVPTLWADDDDDGPLTFPKDGIKLGKIRAGGVVHAQDPPPCKVETQEPIGWEPYGIWEAWWSKLRIQVWKSTDGGPWVKTKDTGWMDTGSGVNLLGSNNALTTEQIAKTAWGSMGAQRPVGAPRAAGAGYVWEGRYVYPGRPAPERMVLHLAQPWKDPVTTTTMDLYPTYSVDGKVNYTDRIPDFKWEYKPKPPGGGQQIDPQLLRDMKPIKPGGGMQQIDPPAQQGDVPEDSILDSFEYMTQPMS